MGKSFTELFFSGGWVMWPLLIFSILTWAVVLERAFVFLTLRPRLGRLGEAVMNSLRSGDASAAKQLCHVEKPYLGAIFLGIIDGKNSRDSAERATERNRIRLMGYFKKNLWILATVGSAAPFVGLLGTVVGIVQAFHDMAEKGAGGFNVVAGGISQALVATAAGLIVAIIALLSYNIFATAANQTVNGLKLTLGELIDQIFDPKPLAQTSARS
jgi:biopolymer transport protein ExbB